MSAITCEEFVDGFNLQNPDIKNVMNNIMTIFVDEAIKLYSKNDETFINKSTMSYSEVTNLDTNHTRYTLKYVFSPVEYISRISTMLTDKTAIVTEFNFLCYGKSILPAGVWHKDQPKESLTWVNKVKDVSGIKFNYETYYESILHKSLTSSFSFAIKSSEHSAGVNFEDKCRVFYHLILGYMDVIDHAYKDRATSVNCILPLNIVNMIEKIKVGCKVTPGNKYNSSGSSSISAYCQALDSNGHIQVSGKNIDRITKYKELMTEFMCDVVAYGYTAEKLTRLKDVKSYNDIIAVVQYMIDKNDDGERVKNKLTELLESLDINSVKQTETETETGTKWVNSCECYVFVVKTICNQLISEKLLLTLCENSDNTSKILQTSTNKRISDLHEEIRSSNEYLLKVFAQFIYLKKQEIEQH